MTNKVKEKNTEKKHIALKLLCTSKGQFKKNDEFTCTAKEYEIFKKSKAV